VPAVRPEKGARAASAAPRLAAVPVRPPAGEQIVQRQRRLPAGRGGRERNGAWTRRCPMPRVCATRAR